MIPVISFWVDGLPIAQPRQKQTKFGGNYLPKDHPVQYWKVLVAESYKRAYEQEKNPINLNKPIALTLLFMFPRPKNMQWKTRLWLRLWHTKKPDLDNLIKAVKDSLNGIAWCDDAQVFSLLVQKYICSATDKIGCSVVIEYMESESENA